MQRVHLDYGDAEFNLADCIVIGDHAVPQRISVHFPSGPEDGRPTTDMTIELVDGVPLCTQLTLTKDPNGHEVRSGDLRLVTIENWVEHIVDACAQPLDVDRTTGPARSLRQPVREVRYQKVTREHLEKVAAVYRENITGNPVRAVEAEFVVSHRTASRWVEFCRSDEYQLLPKTVSGRKKA